MAAIAGVFGVPDAAEIVMRMLQDMQHRGQEAAGIASTDGNDVYDVRGTGLVDKVFEHVDLTQSLPGHAAIGHIRRSNESAPKDTAQIQPFTRRYMDLPLAIVHMGKLTNSDRFREEAKAKGAIFATENDAETMLHAMAMSEGERLTKKFERSFGLLEGAWTTMLLTTQSLMVARDPLGYRPLHMAPYRGGFAFASESCALGLINARDHESVEPGRLVIVSTRLLETWKFADLPYSRMCPLELTYFSRPDSDPYGVSAHKIRARLGRALARREIPVSEERARIDAVTAVPDSSNAMASEYAKTLGVDREDILVRSHWMGRVSGREIRRDTKFGARMKLAVVPSLANGRILHVVDDSIVHGVATKKAVALLRAEGAKEVHLRICSAPTVAACPYGVNEDDVRTLARTGRDDAAVLELTGADSLRHTTTDDLFEALGPNSRNEYCTECMGGPKPPCATKTP